MATTDVTRDGKVTDVPIEGQKHQNSPWQNIALLGILLVSTFLNFFDLQRIGYGNTYYAAAVRSMLDSWHNFFFVSFDPGGYVTIDKPPLGFWLQALSAKIFGFNGVSLMLPSALAGVASVALLYYLVRRYFGPIAGLIAALALALTPISVVINRDNNVDGILVLALLAGAWAVSRASETGNLRWLLLSAVFVGLGFNVKSLEAYLVVPAYGLMYLLGAPISWKARILHLVLATLVLLLISLSWMTIVDLTPASQRPYVGSSQTNSELELALGYNGVQRLVGGLFNRGGARRATTNTNATQEAQQATFGGPGGAGENGAASPLRLFDSQIGGQISWLLPLAILGLIVAAWQTRIRLPLNRKQQALVLWGMELLTMGVFFSVASFYHTYYMTTLGPAISALTGIGLVALWQEYRREDWHGWLLPLTLIITAGVQIYMLTYYASWTRILMAVIAVLVLVAAIVLALARLNITLSLRLRGTSTQAMVVTGLIALLLAPGLWSFITVFSSGGGALPTAGPRAVSGTGFGAGGFPGGNFPGAEGRGNTDRIRGEGFRGGFGGGGFGGPDTAQTDTKLIQYLEANQGSTRYLLATTNANTASPFILATNKPVMALGGFLGTDPILTQQQLAQLVANGTVRYFLIQDGRGGTNALPTDLPPQLREQLEEFLGGNGGGAGGFGGFGASSLTSWVTQHCSTVPTNQWQSSSSTGNAGGFGGAQQLYDCKAA